jgi:hypothetical protein
MIQSVLALAILIGQLPAGESPGQPTDPSGSITAIAQEQVSGVPLEGVTIKLVLFGATDRIFEAKTFSNGTVEFTNLAAGKFEVSLPALPRDR